MSAVPGDDSGRSDAADRRLSRLTSSQVLQPQHSLWLSLLFLHDGLSSLVSPRCCGLTSHFSACGAVTAAHQASDYHYTSASIWQHNLHKHFQLDLLGSRIHTTVWAADSNLNLPSLLVITGSHCCSISLLVSVKCALLHKSRPSILLQ